MNLAQPSLEKYAYSYGQATSCAGNLLQGKERYAWIDLSAGPVFFGPVLNGEGIVQSVTAPRLMGHGQDHRNAFLVDIVTMINVATKMLLVPSINKFPTEFLPDTNVHLITITNTPYQEHHPSTTPEHE